MRVISPTSAALALALVAAMSPSAQAKTLADYEREFTQWMAHHGHSFANDALEYARRLETYITNDQFIHQHNAENKYSFTLGHNAYSHLSFDEFKQRYTGLKISPAYLAKRQSQKPTGLLRNIKAPEAQDWVTKGGVTPVKNQGQCGSCWAFSTTGAVEGAAYVTSGSLVSVSEQQLVDCDDNGDMGCNGGLMDHAFEWIEKHKGLCKEEDYAYVAKQGVCKACEAAVKVTGFQDVDPNDEAQLKVAVSQQPVSVAIEADQREFQFYKSGVFDKKCGTQLDHGVLAVGYGEEGGAKFWKVKNSWGDKWGENGYIRLSREAGSAHGQCGIAMVPSYPFASIIKKDEHRNISTTVAAAKTVVAPSAPGKTLADYEREFTQWMAHHGHSFANDALEYARRLETYITNDQFIHQHNAENKYSFTLGHNAYSHLSFDEFKQRYTGLKISPAYLAKRQSQKPTGLLRNIKAPEAQDWVTKGGVTPVKNQGQCGSCWAFSTTGAVEGAAYVTSGSLVSVSEQQLVDCDDNGDMGCNGGLMDHAFEWIEKHKGLCKEEDYAYVAKEGVCKACEAAVKVTGFQDVDPNDEAQLKVAVSQQPVSVAIEADQREFQFYKSGVFDKKCGTQLDHGVLAVGYGEEGGAKFWKVKNSWGDKWGENGYIRLSREAGSAHGQCGIAMAPSYPFASIVKKDEHRNISTTIAAAKTVVAPFVSVGSSAKITQCGDKTKSLVVFDDLEIAPSAPKRGKPVTFFGNGEIKKPFEGSAVFQLDVRLAGERVFGHKGKICGETHVPLPLGLGHIDVHGFKCPAAAGKFEDLKVDVNLPKIAPRGDYEIQFTATTPSSDDLFCVHVDLDLTHDGEIQEDTKTRVFEPLTAIM